MASPGIYRVDEPIGRGAFATVYRGHRRGQADRPVAIKVLRDEHLENAGVLDRIKDEARVLSLLQHPNIVSVHVLHDYGGRPVIEMELIEGAGLDDVLSCVHGGLPASVVVRVIRLVSGALAYAYDAPGEDEQPMCIVHRDIKPGNIVLSTSGAVKVVDFGIAKGSFRGRQAKTLHMVLGSLGYAPPERRHGDSDLPSGDVYSLGMTMFELLAGKPMILPREAEAHGAAVQDHLRHVPRGELDDESVRALSKLIAWMLAHAPSDRPSFEEVQGILASLTLAGPSLEAFAAQWVPPLLARKQADCRLWHAPDVGFLEQAAPTILEPIAGPKAEAMVVQMLALPDWTSRLSALHRVVERSEQFPSAPLLAVLQRAARPRWMFWVRRPTGAEVEAVLMLMSDHPSAELLGYASILARSSDERTATAAAFVCNRLKA